ncbi:ATP-binding protein [Sphaerisporangium aureirubrum]|uniref:ATP-binding protein n=1 Tax=Sphaerisporangium aureirubrum TaxID=1544736 RepID=A0ABW1NJA9_9ACTN
MTTSKVLGSLDLIGAVASVPVARAFVRETLGATHPALDDVTLLASELTTNAVLHSDSRDGGPVRLTLAEHDHAVRLTVTDTGSATHPRPNHDPCGEHGRGLLLVEGISQAWGVTNEATSRSVWCEVKF